MMIPITPRRARFLAMAHRSPMPGTTRKPTDTTFVCSRLMPHPGRLRGCLYDNADVSWIAPHDWLVDGETLLVQLQRVDRTAQIGFIAVKGGSFRALKSIEWQGSSRIFLSPDGTQIAYDLPQQDNHARDVFVLRTDGSREVAIAPHAAMDLVAGWSPDGGRCFSRATVLAPLDCGRSALQMDNPAAHQL